MRSASFARGPIELFALCSPVLFFMLPSPTTGINPFELACKSCQQKIPSPAPPLRLSPHLRGALVQPKPSQTPENSQTGRALTQEQRSPTSLRCSLSPLTPPGDQCPIFCLYCCWSACIFDSKSPMWLCTICITPAFRWLSLFSIACPAGDL